MDSNSAPALTLTEITKSFGGVQVLQSVSFDVRPGEVHALVGENGAGKSTLMKIAAGIHQPDSGRCAIGGHDFAPRNPSDALRAGIAMVHQELSLAPDLCVAENIFAGVEPRRFGFVKWFEMHSRAERLLSRFNLDVDPRTPVGLLGSGQRQVIEVLKALVWEPRVIVFDEPTSSLEVREVSLLHETIRKLASQSIGVVYITHKLDEIFLICDRVTVLRDGLPVFTKQTRDVTRDAVVNAMVGREMTELYPPRASQKGEELFRVDGFSRNGSFWNVSFSLRRGEILGFSGLVGCGRTKLMRAIFGADRTDEGQVYLDGRRINTRSCRDAVEAGIAYLPEDRKTQGLFLDRSVEENIASSSLGACSVNGFIRHSMMSRLARDYCARLSIAARGIEQEVGTLSGGSQQKVLLARWMARKPRVLIVNEPTRGVDVGAKGEIHRMLRDYAEAGNGVIVVSSEMPEVLGLCDRILVMRKGRIQGELDWSGATEERLVALAVGAS